MNSSRDIRREIEAQQQEVDAILEDLGDELEDAAREVRETLAPETWLEKPIVWAAAGGLVALWIARRLLTRYLHRRDFEAALRRRLPALPPARRG